MWRIYFRICPWVVPYHLGSSLQPRWKFRAYIILVQLDFQIAMTLNVLITTISWMTFRRWSLLSRPFPCIMYEYYWAGPHTMDVKMPWNIEETAEEEEPIELTVLDEKKIIRSFSPWFNIIHWHVLFTTIWADLHTMDVMAWNIEETEEEPTYWSWPVLGRDLAYLL